MSKYSMTRKINLGRYGLQFESIDIGVSDCDSKEEAIKEITEWKEEILKPIKENLKRKEDIQNGDIPFEDDVFKK